MSWLDGDGNATIEVGPAHIGSGQHAPKPMVHPPGRWYAEGDDEQTTKLIELFGGTTALAGALGLQWCAECHDFHEIAGGPSARVRTAIGSPSSSAVMGGDGAPTL